MSSIYRSPEDFCPERFSDQRAEDTVEMMKIVFGDDFATNNTS